MNLDRGPIAAPSKLARNAAQRAYPFVLGQHLQRDSAGRDLFAGDTIVRSDRGPVKNADRRVDDDLGLTFSQAVLGRRRFSAAGSSAAVRVDGMSAARREE